MRVLDKGDEERERESVSDQDGGGRLGGFFAREEVICQIGFHSLLRLRAACQPGRLTVSDSPLSPRVGAYTPGPTGVSARAGALPGCSTLAAGPDAITDPAIHYCEL